MATTSYAIALGSNRRGRHGAPAREVMAAIAALGDVTAASPILHTAPLGPSKRRYANAVVILETAEDPPELLARLKAIERGFGRRPGQRWAARALDLDIILWSEGPWSSPGLTIPHPLFRTRDFVLAPLAGIAPNWRDPITNHTVRHLRARLPR